MQVQHWVNNPSMMAIFLRKRHITIHCYDCMNLVGYKCFLPTIHNIHKLKSINLALHWYPATIQTWLHCIAALYLANPPLLMMSNHVVFSGFSLWQNWGTEVAKSRVDYKLNTRIPNEINFAHFPGCLSCIPQLCNIQSTVYRSSQSQGIL